MVCCSMSGKTTHLTEHPTARRVAPTIKSINADSLASFELQAILIPQGVAGECHYLVSISSSSLLFFIFQNH